jgi:hypothetical protein
MDHNYTFREYIDFAERCLNKAEKDQPISDWYLIPACTLAWSSIESFVNNMLDDFSSIESNYFSKHEEAFLLEKKLVFMNSGADIGQFVLRGSEYRKLEDKIFFLIAKCSGPDLLEIKGETLWQKFKKFKETRDFLAHPRRANSPKLDPDKISSYIDISKEIIRLISINVWKKNVIF